MCEINSPVQLTVKSPLRRSLSWGYCSLHDNMSVPEGLWGEILWRLKYLEELSSCWTMGLFLSWEQCELHTNRFSFSNSPSESLEPNMCGSSIAKALPFGASGFYSHLGPFYMSPLVIFFVFVVTFFFKLAYLLIFYSNKTLLSCFLKK